MPPGSRGDVVPLERLELADRDLRRVGNLAQRDTPLFARMPHPRAEIVLGRL